MGDERLRGGGPLDTSISVRTTMNGTYILIYVYCGVYEFLIYLSLFISLLLAFLSLTSTLLWFVISQVLVHMLWVYICLCSNMKQDCTINIMRSCSIFKTDTYSSYYCIHINMNLLAY